MQFEDLQAIWNTQDSQPAFSMDDSRLAVALYQQRAQSRRRLFLYHFAPLYVSVIILALFGTGVFVAFYFKTAFRVRTSDPLMNGWDGAALAIAVIASLQFIGSLYLQHRKHEQSQNLFAPTLRQELERGLAQLDFELSLHTTARIIQASAISALGAIVIVVESARLNGQPVLAWGLPVAILAVIAGYLSSIAGKKKVETRVAERRRAMETMLAALDEIPTLTKES